MPGSVGIDQSIPGTTNRVAADFTLGGAAAAQGHGVAATALRVELPTDGTGKVGLNAGSAVVGSVGIDQSTPGTTNRVAAGGDVAHDAVDSGNPIKVGARADSTYPAPVVAGDRVNLWANIYGAQVVSVLRSQIASDGLAAAGLADLSENSRLLGVAECLWGGNDWERRRNNQDLTLLASAARTASVSSADQTNHNGRGLHIVIDVTAAAGAPSLVFTIQGKCPASGQYYTLLASAAVTGVGTTVLRVFPGATVVANLKADDIVPRTWRVSVAATNADSITYSVGSSLIL